MTTLNTRLPEPLSRYVEEQVRTGRYGTIDDYFRQLVEGARDEHAQADRMVRESIEIDGGEPLTDEQWQAMRPGVMRDIERQLLEGLDSGESTELTQADWDELRRKLREQFGEGKSA